MDATSEPKTARGRATRERLVAVAAAAVAEHGVNGLKVDEVLQSAGVSKSQMYHYFPDRDGLLTAAVAERCCDVVTQLIPAFSSVDSLPVLRAVLTGFADEYALAPTGCPIGSLASALTDGPPDALTAAANALGDWQSMLTDALERIRSNGGLRGDASAEHLAAALLAGLEGGMFLSQVWNEPQYLRDALAAALGYLETYQE